MREVLQETTRTTAFIFAVLLGATAFSLVLRGLGGDELIERLLLGLLGQLVLSSASSPRHSFLDSSSTGLN